METIWKNNNFEIINYSEKSIAVIGATIQITKLLMLRKGRYNKFLECGPGWIFSKAKTDMATLTNMLDNVRIKPDKKPTKKATKPAPESTNQVAPVSAAPKQAELIF